MSVDLTHEQLEHAFELLSDHAMHQRRRYDADQRALARMSVEVSRVQQQAEDEARRNRRRELDLGRRASDRLECLAAADACVTEWQRISGLAAGVTPAIAEAHWRKLQDRNKELYEALRGTEDVCIDEGLFDEDDRMTERLAPPTTPAGVLSCELAADAYGACPGPPTETKT